MLSLATSQRPRWMSNSDRNRVIKINNVSYELHLSNATSGRLVCHQLVAGTPRIVNVIEIPLGKSELYSMFDARTAADIIRVAQDLRS